MENLAKYSGDVIKAITHGAGGVSIVNLSVSAKRIFSATQLFTDQRQIWRRPSLIYAPEAILFCRWWNEVFLEEWTRAGKSRVWGYAAVRQASQMLVLTSTCWTLIDIGVGFLQLFGRTTWEVNSFPRLKGATCKISTSLPLGFTLCVFLGSWIPIFQCTEIL